MPVADVCVTGNVSVAGGIDGNFNRAVLIISRAVKCPCPEAIAVGVNFEQGNVGISCAALKTEADCRKNIAKMILLIEKVRNLRRNFPFRLKNNLVPSLN